MAAQTSGAYAPVHRRRVSGEPSRRPRDLDLRRARQGRHDASGVPQHGADDRPAVRRAARSRPAGRADDADRHRHRRLHPQVLQGVAQRRGAGRRARRDRRVGARDLRLDRPQPGLQGRVPGHARRQRRLTTRRTTRTRAAGTRRSTTRSPSSTTRSSIRRSIATSRSTKSRTCTCTSRRRPTPASSSAAPRSWRRRRRSRTSTSSPTTARCRSRPSRSPSSAWCRRTPRA